MSGGKSSKIGRLGFPSNPEQPRDDRDPEVVGVEQGLAELNAGLSVPLEDVDAWIDSWGTANELPMPQPRRRQT